MKSPIRTCGECGEATLLPVSRQFSGFGTVVRYQCKNCTAELELTPQGGIGVVTSVGIIALIFWGAILFHGNSRPNMFALILYCAAVMALLFVTALPAFLNFKNPPAKSGELADTEFETTNNDIMKRIMILVEKTNFLTGLFLPLIVVGAILSAAALIGFINFTYFGN